MKKYKSNNLHYDNREIFGLDNNWYKFYILLGSRGYGKTYSTQNYCLRQFFKKGRRTIWLRLKEPAVRALLANNAKDFLDSKLILKWGITGVKTEGNNILLTRGDPNDRKSYKEFCKILALSTFYQTKGVALNKDGSIKNKKAGQADLSKAIKKYHNIVLDECNQERSEKKTFDITYAFINQIETICRLDTDRRIILSGNTLDEGSEILSKCFGFVPEEFGIYKLYNKRAIIHYMESSEKYKEERNKSFAGILAPNESTFSNEIDFKDQDLIVGKDNKPIQTIIRFSKTSYFTLTEGVISKKKIPKENNIRELALKPLIGGIPYYKDQADDFIQRVYMRLFKFDTRKTCVDFQSEIKLLKP